MDFKKGSERDFLFYTAVDARSFDRVHQQMDDESIDDLIRGKSGNVKHVSFSV